MKNQHTFWSAAALLAGMLLLAETINAQAPNWQWARCAGGSAWDYAGGIDYNTSTIATDANGNSFITGTFNGTAAFGTVSISSPNYPSVFVAKYDAAGNCLWARKFGGADNDTYGNEGKAIDVDGNGNCYVTGVFNGPAASVIPFGTSTLTGAGGREVFIVKYDANGNEQWALQPGGSGFAANYGKSIATDAAGNSFITGSFSNGSHIIGSTTLTAGPFVLKINSAGSPVWASQIAGIGTMPMAIDCDKLGNSYVTGELQGQDVYPTTPATTLTSLGMRDVFVLKVNSLGAVSWVNQFVTEASSGFTNPTASGKAISIDGSGNIYITGELDKKLIIGTNTLVSTGNGFKRECFVAKLDNNGNAQWAMQSLTTSQNMGNTRGAAIKATQTGNCFFTGTYYPTTGLESFGGVSFPQQTGNQNSYVIRIDSTGTVSWGRFATGSCFTAGIDIDNAGGVYIAGNNQGTSTFNTNSVTSAGGYDVLIAKLANTGGTSTLTAINNPENDADFFTLYPNPVTTTAFVYLNGYEHLQPAELKIYNLLGQEIKAIPITASLTTFEKPEMAKGVYSYQLKGKGGVLKTGKLVIE